MAIRDVSAATMYDVLHDNRYRRDWDPNMEDSYDIARLSANADVGYYSCECTRTVRVRPQLRRVRFVGSEPPPRLSHV